MAPTRGGERTVKEGAWVKKGGITGTSERPCDSTGEDDDKGSTMRTDRREAARGRGRQPRDQRGRREPREKDGSSGTVEESATDGRTARGRGGRMPRGNRRGAAQDYSSEGKENVTNVDETGEELGGTLLNMLKANPPKVTRYTKGELLSIARLPASNIKPVELSPLIDKENKDSYLLMRMASTRQPAAGEVAEGSADTPDARQKRRADRAQRRDAEKPPNEDGEANRPQGEQPKGQQRPATSPSKQETAEVTPPTVEKSPSSTKIPAVEEDVDGAKASRAFDKWFDRKKVEGAPAGSSAAPGTPSAGASATAGKAAAGQSVTAPAPGAAKGFPASLFPAQSQAQALTQAHAMQAYMQAMSMNAAAAVAAANRGYKGIPWGYNPYAAAYMNPYGGGGAGYTPPLDYAISPQALQARLAAAGAANAANALSSGAGLTASGSGSFNATLGAAGRGASADKKSGTPSGASKATPKTSQTTGAVGSTASTAPTASTHVEGFPPETETRKPKTGTDEEEDADCSQS